MVKLGFIGMGNMGKALLTGFKSSSASRETEVFVYDIDTSKEESVRSLGAEFLHDVVSLVKTSDYIVIAVKPQQVADLFKEIKAYTEGKVVVSICAGISIEYIEKRISDKAKIVQVMPNTPMMLGFGASAITKNENVSDREFEYVRSIIDSSGISEILPADKMNEIICINASSPAFIFYITKCFADYAATQGLDMQAALRLFSATLIGSGKMLVDSGMTPDELIKQVSSKGGTTVAGLSELQNGLPELIDKTCKACTKRAYELSAEE